MTSNRLAGAASAYLQSAAHQPIHWYPWGAEAFASARAQDRPVLLDIGAVWCHWCHVMDGESYEDPAVARYLNENFVCIKVDRDERPDVDARYQRAVQAFTRQGGWPLTAFLTPDGDVFYGGTYFPPESKYGQPGFRTVLASVLDAYRSRRGQVDAQAQAPFPTLSRPNYATILTGVEPRWSGVRTNDWERSVRLDSLPARARAAATAGG